ncbi:MAG: HesA/MoeB/ThiF family protein [Candidatus Thermoplasmatota archaeon]|nr:HesA/MoeB/ThiF family protein [Candidatus Thermoplasmatota archaeon]MBU1940725.1 HesA/MoeB/ThiF family protein [Candidatus Thermoplasmatota archaeon]
MMNNRFIRQLTVPEFGENGQKILESNHVGIIGCGGLGSHLADFFVRMGVQTLTIIDDDCVELSNLHRTALYTEKDIGTPKTTTLSKHLLAINPRLKIHAHTTRLTAPNTEQLLASCNIILDGTDNIPTRYLVNELSVKHHIPWVYAGVYSTIGMILAIIPASGPCFSCVHPTLSQPSETNIPVIGHLPAAVAAIQCSEALKILLGTLSPKLIIYNLWTQQIDHLDIQKNPDCPICCKQQFSYLKK